MSDLIVIGGGLAGSEAAWQAAEGGLKVALYEMRPEVTTGAHTGPLLAELVCSNSLGSNLPDRASGVLKSEIRRVGSLLLRCAEDTSVPAGGALAVDRERFAQLVTRKIEQHPNIEIIRKEVVEIPAQLTVVASGPLTSPRFSESLAKLLDREHLFFYDAIAPIISFESINFGVAFRGSRFGRGDLEKGDYINCPMTRQEYEAFIENLIHARRIELKDFELEIEKGVDAGVYRYFEGCLPIEILARRGKDSLAFGPMRPIGLIDPRTGMRPFAVLQLRQDNLSGSLYNLVGFQTNLTYSEQRRVFRLIPGMENAEFVRYGQMHRNTFIFSPGFLLPSLQFRLRQDLLFAGQITGIEGYVGNIATGLMAGINATRLFRGKQPISLPATTMLGALCHYITHANEADFQPMKANFGILTPLEGGAVLGKRRRAGLYAERSLLALEEVIERIGNDNN